MAGSDDYIIQETATNDVVQFGGTGSANFFTHNISSGLIGIGTDNPSKTLTIYGASSSSFRISKSGVLAYDHTFDGSTYTIANNNGSAGIPIVIGTKTAGGESLRITAAGDVGIATETPTSVFDVQVNTLAGINFTNQGQSPLLDFRANDVESAGRIRVGENGGFRS